MLINVRTSCAHYGERMSCFIVVNFNNSDINFQDQEAPTSSGCRYERYPRAICLHDQMSENYRSPGSASVQSSGSHKKISSVRAREVELTNC